MTDTEVKMRAALIAATFYGPVGLFLAMWFRQAQKLQG